MDTALLSPGQYESAMTACCSVLQCVLKCVLQRVTMCCSVLHYVSQFVAVCCRVLQCVAALATRWFCRGSTNLPWQRVAVCVEVCVAVCYSVCCSVLHYVSQCVTVCCSVLLHLQRICFDGAV